MKINYDEACQYGLAVFETLPVKDGQPYWLEAHIQRLSASIAYFNLPLPPSIATDLTAYCHLQQGNKIVKLLISSNNICFTHRPNTYTEEIYQKGFSVTYASTCRNETSPFTFHKTANYGDSILEKRKAHQNGFDEPLFLNTKGYIAEGATTNIFFIKNQTLYTPSLSCGLLPGIVRGYITDTFSAQECLISPNDITQFDECFMTNSVLGIIGVTSCGTYTFPHLNQYTTHIRQKYLIDCTKPFLYKRSY